MRLDFAFSQNIGSLISNGKHPPINALACPLKLNCIYKQNSGSDNSFKPLSK
ncbi:MAG: hypothetical protein VKJ87_06280 [Synechococcus sp.]|nr:hypothetical protein [Synechococcus sp.]